MEIKKGKNRFYIEDDAGSVVGEITFQYEDDNTILANSTFVDPSQRGQGIARKLLDSLADHARENGMKIRPLCSYVVNAFEQSDAYDDIKRT